MGRLSRQDAAEHQLRGTGGRQAARVGGDPETDAPQRNVIGLLQGSDPKLADTYVLVTAHYDGGGNHHAARCRG